MKDFVQPVLLYYYTLSRQRHPHFSFLFFHFSFSDDTQHLLNCRLGQLDLGDAVFEHGRLPRHAHGCMEVFELEVGLDDGRAKRLRDLEDLEDAEPSAVATAAARVAPLA